MRVRLIVNLAIASLAAAAQLYATAAWSDEITCAPAKIRVLAVDPADARTVCDGAAAAAAFLNRHGVATDQDIDVHVVEELPSGAPSTAVGCCAADQRRVYLLTYAEYAKRQRFLFDLPPDRVFYASAATHEVAHALAARSFRVASPNILAHEYIAYVAMLASMPDSHRAQLLELFAGTRLDLESWRAVNLLMFKPMQFGVEAYRHFARQENPAKFLDRVLSGAVLVD